MNDLDESLRRLDRFEAGRRPELDPGLEELLAGIMSTPAAGPVPDDAGAQEIELTTLRPHRRRARWTAGILVAASLVAALTVPAVLGRSNGDQPAVSVSGTPGPQATGTAFTDRVRSSDPAWTAIGYTRGRPYPDEGSQVFVHGPGGAVSVHWHPAGTYARHHAEAAAPGSPEPRRILGQEGSVFAADATHWTAILPVAPGATFFFQIEGDGLSRADFTGFLDSLVLEPEANRVPITPEPGVRNQQDVAEVLAATLADVPQPPGFDPATLWTPAGAKWDDYEWGQVAVKAVFCGWLGQYAPARAAGDEATMATVDAALRASRNWSALRAMERPFAATAWRWADRVHQRQPVTGYEDVFGCTT